MNENPVISLERAVHACFPPEQQQIHVVAARPYGASSRGRTARVTARLPDGSVREFFLRCINSSSDAIIKAEFNSLLRLYNANPHVVPRPHKWGKIQDENNGAKRQETRDKRQETRDKRQEREKERTKEREKEPGRDQVNIGVGRGTQRIIATYFIVCDFVHFSPYLPSPADLCAQLAHINQVSATTGKFGSDVPHYQAGFSIRPASYSYWADCFTSWITEIFVQDTAVNGQWPAYEAAFKDLSCKTIPRLLLPLQENGRKIIPVLVHGNLSTNHLGIRLADGMPVLFSPCAAYAHQEFELGVSELAIGGLDKAYVDQYLRMVLPSEPIDEVYHRIILYGVHFNLRLSASHAGRFRERIYADMLFLNGMYAEN